MTYGLRTIRCAIGGSADFYHGRSDANAGAVAQEAAGQVDPEDLRATERLLSLTAGWERFVGPGGATFARVEIGGHVEIHRLPSEGLKAILRERYFALTQKVSPTQPILDVLGFLAGQTRRVAGQEDVFVRVGKRDNRVFVDLGDPTYSVLEVDETGWRRLDHSPVNFVRPKGATPLPEPIPGGSLEELKRVLNLRSEEDLVLLVGWLLAVLRGAGPYPVLVLLGEQGSAKSTAARLLKELVDPSAAPLRSIPGDERNLVIAASGALVVAFDNVSALTPDMSDSICRVATGAGLVHRQLYTDEETVIFDLARPVLMTGIQDFVKRGDLADRSLFVHFEPILESERKRESEINAEFAELRPRLLGALLDAVGAALRNEGSVSLEELPRMADAAAWVTAAEEVLPWPPGSYLRALKGSAEDAVEFVLQSDPVGVAILKMLEVENFHDTATVLLQRLSDRFVSEDVRRSRAWPKAPNTLSNRLSQLAPALRARGFEVVTRGKDHGGRYLSLRNPKLVSSPSSRRPEPRLTFPLRDGTRPEGDDNGSGGDGPEQ